MFVSNLTANHFECRTTFAQISSRFTHFIFTHRSRFLSQRKVNNYPMNVNLTRGVTRPAAAMSYESCGTVIRLLNEVKRQAAGHASVTVHSAISSGHTSSSSNPAEPRQAALRAACRDPAGGPSSFHTASRHASWPYQRRRLSLRSFFGKNLPLYSPRIVPGLGCFAFLPFCQCVSFNSVLAQ